MYINIISDNINQCPYVRFKAPVAYNEARLEKVGLNIQFNPKEIDYDSTVIFQRPTSPEVFELQKEMFSASKQPVLMDFDDALWDLSIYERMDKAHKESAGRLVGSIRDLMRNHCDGIVVSTKYIGEQAQKITDKPIIVMPNAVNPRFAPTTHSKTILYAGAGNRTHDFSKEWKDAIKEMRKQGYKFISTTKFGIEDERLPLVAYGDHYNRLRYYAPEYYIAPLEDSELNRGRSNLKEIEAASINAKFLGGIGVEPDFTKAKIPTLSPEQDYTSGEYAKNFVKVYSGLWLGGN